MCYCLFSTVLFGQLIPIQPVFQSGHQSEISKVLFQKSNEHVVSASIDGTIVVWNLRLGLQRQTVQAHDNGLSDMVLISDSLLISSDNSGVCKLWSLPNLTLMNEVIIETGIVHSLCKITDSTLAIAGSRLHVWSFYGKKVTEIDVQKKADINSMAYIEDQKVLVLSGVGENVITFLSAEKDFRTVKEVIGNAKTLKVKNQTLLQVNRVGEFRYYFLSDGRRHSYSLKEDIHSVTDVSHKTSQFAITTTLGQILILNKNHQLEQRLAGGGGAFTAVNYSENEKWMAAGDVEGQVYIYNCENYDLKYFFNSVSSSISDVKINENDLVLGYTDGSIRELNLLSNEIKTNSIKATDIEQRNGISYAIVSIDSITETGVLFSAARIKKDHDQLTSLQKLSCKWDSEKNQIIILDKKRDKDWDDLIREWDQTQQRYNLDKLLPEFEHSTITNTTFNFTPGQDWFYYIRNSDTLVYETLHKSPLRGVYPIPNKQIVLSFSKEPGFKIWNYQGDYLATLYLSGQAKYAYFTSDNYYFASKGLMNKIGFLFQDELYSFEQFDPYFNRPDKIISQLNLADSATVALYQLAHEKRLSRLDLYRDNFELNASSPYIEVSEVKKQVDQIQHQKFKLIAKDSVERITSYSYSINGAVKTFKLEQPQHTIEVQIEIELSWGINELAFKCRNEKGINSLVHKQIINNEVRHNKPDLYLLTMGVSTYEDTAYALRFADKDAAEVAHLFSKNKKQYQKVFTKTLLNDQVTKESLKDISDFLSQSKTNDRIIAYFAGHGVLDKKLSYYLATYDLNFAEPEQNGISFEEFESIIENQQCRNKLILIDACHSGEIDQTVYEINTDTDSSENEELNFRGGGINILQKNGVQIGVLELSKLLFPDLRGSQGTTIISSSAGSEFAYEDENLENGIFTYILQKALSGYEADRNGDKQILLSELQYYLRKEVSNFSKGKQNPVSRKENIQNDFVLW